MSNARPPKPTPPDVLILKEDWLPPSDLRFLWIARAVLVGIIACTILAYVALCFATKG